MATKHCGVDGLNKKRLIPLLITFSIVGLRCSLTLWLIRNNRVITRDGAPASEEEIKNKWKFAVNQRLQVDKLLANRPLRGKHPALAQKLVLETWSGTLDNESSLPANWLREPRVLVGSRAFPQTQTRQRLRRGIG
ncbi:hypothetical protein B0H14DRAFT_2411394 [Mycena olivaceomarginata]|nr:hypothetical protein B0H14DRAFT_2411394 [Mycena olivaceomarginata]